MSEILKQLVFIDTSENNMRGTVEKFHAEGVIMHSDESIRISQTTNLNENQMVLDVYGHILADKIRGRSDARLKTNISGITNSLDVVRSLCGKVYNLKNESKKSYGLIAQEVQQTLPDIVYQDNEGYLNLSYLELIPFLIESIKEIDDKLTKVLEQVA